MKKQKRDFCSPLSALAQAIDSVDNDQIDDFEITSTRCFHDDDSDYSPCKHAATSFSVLSSSKLSTQQWTNKTARLRPGSPSSFARPDYTDCPPCILSDQVPCPIIAGALPTTENFAHSDKNNNNNASSSSSLPIEIFSNVFKFLAPPDLLRLVSTSKEMNDVLTYDDVMDQAFLADRYRRTSISKIVDLVRACKIYCPSATRLLRICSGKFCEMPKCKRKVRVVKEMGLFVCKACPQKSSDSFKSLRKDSLSPTNLKAQLLKHPQMSLWEFESKYILVSKPFLTCNFELAGPLISAIDFERLPNFDSLEDFTLSLEVNTTRMERLLEANRKALQRKKKKSIIKLAREEKWRQQKLLTKRRTVLNVLRKVSSSAYLNSLLRTCAVAVTWIPEESGGVHNAEATGSCPCRMEFDCKLLKGLGIEDQLVRAPNTIKTEAICTIINEQLKDFLDVGFLGASFLQTRTSPFQRNLEVYFKSNVSFQDLIMEIDHADLAALKDCGPLKSFERVVSRIPLRSTVGAGTCSFSHAVLVHMDVRQTDGNRWLVESLWTFHLQQLNQSLPFFMTCEAAFVRTTNTFSSAKGILLKYLDASRTLEVQTFAKSTKLRLVWADMLTHIWRDVHVISLVVKLDSNKGGTADLFQAIFEYQRGNALSSR